MTQPRTLASVLEGERLPGLDGCRAIAVGAVVVSHSGTAAYGDLGVTFFFVLSGFLITWLLLREQADTGTISLPRFYARRTLRIFPAYYAFLALSIGWDLFRGDERIRGAIVPSLFYLTNYYNALHGHPPISVAHAWSLAVEEQFYLLWPMAMLLLARGGPPRITRGLVSAILLVVAWRSLAFLGLGASTAYVYNVFESRFDALALGCLIAIGARSDWLQGVASRLASSRVLPLVTLGLLLVSRRFGPLDYRYSVGMTLESVLLGVLLIQLLLLSGTPAWRWLEWRWIRYLGVLSYPVYLYHQLGLGAGQKLLGEGPVAFLVGCAATFLLAAASHHLLETPFLRLKSRFSSTPRAAT